MHRSAITPEPPDRAVAPDTDILNSNQTAKRRPRLSKYGFFIPHPVSFYRQEKIFGQTETEARISLD
jgi:hypothetical protein